jgi:acetyl esterase
MNGAPLELVTRRFVDALMAAGGPPIYTLSPADARALLAGQQSVSAAKPDARIEDATFPVGPSLSRTSSATFTTSEKCQ